ncbi:MAG: 4-diphosphocytidyl-2C-methyl-D-erythritol synthase [Proteobacteria bacterium]|nr:MAG: 4-diphosphocytidyl-2C-methyl-D-erythritol synthase [Pseudomonadota bacterium]
MGRPKACLGWGGRPLVVHQCEVLAGFAEVVVVVGHAADALRAIPLPPPARFVDNPAWAQGRSTTFEAGARALRTDPRALLVVAVDQPLDGAVVDALLAAYDPTQRGYAVPRCGERRGHPVLIGPTLWPELRHATRHPMGLRGILGAARQERLEVPIESPSIGWNLNTPEGYRAAVAAHDGAANGPDRPQKT